MPDPTREASFSENFRLQLSDPTQNIFESDDAKKGITDALAEASISKLSRIFNSLPLPDAVMEQIYNEVGPGNDPEEQARQAVLNIKDVLFNPEMTDLKAGVKDRMGPENLKNCLLACYRERELSSRAKAGEDLSNIKAAEIFPPSDMNLDEDLDLKKRMITGILGAVTALYMMGASVYIANKILPELMNKFSSREEAEKPENKEMLDIFRSAANDEYSYELNIMLRKALENKTPPLSKDEIEKAVDEERDRLLFENPMVLIKQYTDTYVTSPIGQYGLIISADNYDTPVHELSTIKRDALRAELDELSKNINIIREVAPEHEKEITRFNSKIEELQEKLKKISGTAVAIRLNQELLQFKETLSPELRLKLNVIELAKKANDSISTEELSTSSLRGYQVYIQDVINRTDDDDVKHLAVKCEIQVQLLELSKVKEQINAHILELSNITPHSNDIIEELKIHHAELQNIISTLEKPSTSGERQANRIYLDYMKQTINSRMDKPDVKHLREVMLTRQRAVTVNEKYSDALDKLRKANIYLRSKPPESTDIVGPFDVIIGKLEETSWKIHQQYLSSLESKSSVPSPEELEKIKKDLPSFESFLESEFRNPYYQQLMDAAEVINNIIELQKIIIKADQQSENLYNQSNDPAVRKILLETRNFLDTENSNLLKLQQGLEELKSNFMDLNAKDHSEVAKNAAIINQKKGELAGFCKNLMSKVEEQEKKIASKEPFVKRFFRDFFAKLSSLIKGNGWESAAENKEHETAQKTQGDTIAKMQAFKNKLHNIHEEHKQPEPQANEVEEVTQNRSSLSH